MKRKMLCIIYIVLIISVPGCTSKSCTSEKEQKPPVNIPNSLSLRAFTSDTEMAEYIKIQFASSVFFYEDTDRGGSSTSLSDDSAPLASGEDSKGNSKTNIQEEGVDESDKVKTDGSYIFVAGDRQVSIVKTTSDRSMKEASTIELNGYPDSLYLYNKILIILYQPYEMTWSEMSYSFSTSALPTWISSNACTGVMFIDVTDPLNPVVLKEIEIDGSLVSSRLTGGRMYLVQQFGPSLPDLNTYYEWTDDGLEKARSDNLSKLESVETESLVPHYRVVSGNDDNKDIQLLNPSNTFHPSIGAGGSIVSVTSFNLDDSSLGFESLGIVADAQVVYASKNNIYLSNILWDRNSPYYTKELYGNQLMGVYKIAFDKNSMMAEGAGIVKGWILNQFSLGESDGVLRIATTDTSSGTPTNAVYCIREEGGSLKTIGSIENITPGEKLYSARFIGEKGFLVTFKQIDPLITLNLSDPEKPEIKGELLLPGYSTYIHPLNENYLLTIGRDTSINGSGGSVNQGILLTIFNVQDMTRPKVEHQLIAGNSDTYSEALYNHKAITFMPEKGILAFHMNSGYGNSSSNSKSKIYVNENGLYVFEVSLERGFSLLGDIPDYNSNYANWARGIIIGDSVYSVSQDSIGAATLSDIAGGISWVLLGGYIN